MPTSVNGVGTHYYGKKNKKERHAVCQHCGHQSVLTSYETRLWFVVFFVPLIPFGRRRIADQCAVCSRHYVIPAGQWETTRQTSVATALESWRQDESEDAAILVHATLYRYQQHEEAAEFRETVLERFPDSAQLRAELGNHLYECGLPDDARELWEQAWDLDPQHPASRIGKAQCCMTANELDEARELLEFLLEPGAGEKHNLQPLLELAHRYQLAGQHQQTLDLVQPLLEQNEDFAADHQIRSFVRKSEKALKPEQSILPPLNHSLSKLFTSQYSSNYRRGIGVAIAGALVMVGLAINNEYLRRHQPLTIINALPIPATVQIDDQPPVEIEGMETLSVAEGTAQSRSADRSASSTRSTCPPGTFSDGSTIRYGSATSEERASSST